MADFSSNKTADDQEVMPYTRPRCKTPEPPKPLNKCEGLKLNEIASHVDEPFIELVNGSNKTITTAGCKLAIGSNNSQDVLGDIELKSGELWAVKVNHTKLKLPKTKGKVYILDEAGAEIDSCFPRQDVAFGGGVTMPDMYGSGDLSNQQKAAILFIAIGPEYSAKLFQHMDDDKIERSRAHV